MLVSTAANVPLVPLSVLSELVNAADKIPLLQQIANRFTKTASLRMNISEFGPISEATKSTNSLEIFAKLSFMPQIDTVNNSQMVTVLINYRWCRQALHYTASTNAPILTLHS